MPLVRPGTGRTLGCVFCQTWGFFPSIIKTERAGKPNALTPAPLATISP
jgi:hypothetical protein